MSISFTRVQKFSVIIFSNKFSFVALSFLLLATHDANVGRHEVVAPYTIFI